MLAVSAVSRSLPVYQYCRFTANETVSRMTINLLLAAGCMAAVSVPVLTRMTTEVGVMENRSTLDLAMIAIATRAVYAPVERWSLRDRGMSRRGRLSQRETGARERSATEDTTRAA